MAQSDGNGHNESEADRGNRLDGEVLSEKKMDGAGSGSTGKNEPRAIGRKVREEQTTHVVGKWVGLLRATTTLVSCLLRGSYCCMPSDGRTAGKAKLTRITVYPSHAEPAGPPTGRSFFGAPTKLTVVSSGQEEVGAI